jgi:hypothetical protein
MEKEYLCILIKDLIKNSDGQVHFSIFNEKDSFEPTFSSISPLGNTSNFIWVVHPQRLER